jgi:hypothetical protein
MSPRSICTLVLIFCTAGIGSAQTAKDPLRFVPSHAEAVAKIDRPRELLETVLQNELFQQAQKLAGVREYYDSTNFQRVYQLIAYFEKQLGKTKEELLDELGAGGIVVAAKFSEPGGVLLVMQAKDEAGLRRFVDLALDVIDKELDRQESKDRIVRTKYHGFDIGQIGPPKVSFAIADAALLVASDDKVLKAALDALKNKEQKGIAQTEAFIDARKQAPKGAMAWAWLHLEQIREKNPNFKNGLDAAASDPFQMLIFGGLSNTLRRAPYLTVAVTRDGANYRLGFSMPRGREGMGALSHMLLPTDGNGTLPPLMPPRTISSTSYFLDLGRFWDKRVDILGAQNAKGLDEAEQNVAKFLGGIKLSKLLNAMGTHHRVVVTQPKEHPYKVQPAQRFPSFALVVDMRDPSFAKDMNSIFRAGALLATFSYGLNLRETKHNEYDMVSYYFSETKKVEGDPANLRFNFSPSYVTVGNQLVMSSSAELARDLIDVLKAEKSAKANAASMRTHVHASGLTAVIKANDDNILTQLILSQALPPNTAKKELHAIIDWVEQLGSLRVEQTYGGTDFRYEILWQPKEPRTK